ncbi:hypothetical protein EFS87_02840 [Staphylococcus pseudintermedius]|nr:hypothetical protein [Staphylococcus pseudintermedius]
MIPLIFKSHKFEKSKMAKSLFLQLFNSVSLQKINFKIPMQDMAFTKIAQQAITERRSDV